MNLGFSAALLMQVASPAQKLARWRNNVKDHPLDLYIGKRRVVHTGNWLINVSLATIYCTAMYNTALSFPDSFLIKDWQQLHSPKHASSVLRIKFPWRGLAILPFVQIHAR